MACAFRRGAFQIYLDQGLEKKEAMKRTAKDRGVSKRDIYQKLIRKKLTKYVKKSVGHLVQNPKKCLCNHALALFGIFFYTKYIEKNGLRFRRKHQWQVYH